MSDQQVLEALDFPTPNVRATCVAHPAGFECGQVARVALTCQVCDMGRVFCAGHVYQLILAAQAGFVMCNHCMSRTFGRLGDLFDVEPI